MALELQDFYNIVLPGQYSYGATMGPNFMTNKIETNSGRTQRNIIWESALWDFNIDFTTQRKEQADDLEALYLQLYGEGIGFLFDNKKDNAVLKTVGVANSDGVLKGKPKFRLFKTYYHSLTHKKYYKRIFKPKTGTVKIYNNNVLVNWTVDYETGTVDLPVLSSKEIQGISKATNAVVTCNNHGFSSGDKVYLDNVKGMVEINNMVVTVSNVTTNTFTIGVNTLAFSTFIYTSATTYAKKYITGTENITWEGNFYFPVVFGDAKLLTDFADYNSFNIKCSLQEIRLDEVNEHLLDD